MAELPVAVQAEVQRFLRDRWRTRVFEHVLWAVGLGFLGWLVLEIMVRGRLDLASIVLQVLMILTGAARVVLSYWDQVPALVYGLQDGSPEVQATCRAAWDHLQGAPGDRLWELAPSGRREDRPTVEGAVALLAASQRTPWRRVAPVCFWVYVVLVVAGVSWFVSYEPAPEFDGYDSISK